MKVLPRFLAIVSALMLPLALVAVWADQFVTDTSGYVQTVGPLAEDPEVREAAAARLAAATNGVVRNQVGGGAANRAGAFTEDVAITVVGGDGFARVWRNANGLAHQRFERALEDDRQTPVILDLSPVVGQVLDELRAEGVSLPELDTSNSLRIRLASSSRVDVVRTTYTLVDRYGTWFAGVWALLLLAAIGLARDRRAVLAWASSASVVTTAVLYLALWLGDELAVSSIPATDQPLVQAVYDVLTQDLGLWALIALGVSLVVTVLNAVIPHARRTPEPV